MPGDSEAVDLDAVRVAERGEFTEVMAVLEGALLDVDPASTRERIRDGSVLVYADGDRVAGAIVLDDHRIEAIAVRPRRRGMGVGRALVRAAHQRVGALCARYDDAAKPFYDALGFSSAPVGDGYLGVLRAA